MNKKTFLLWLLAFCLAPILAFIVSAQLVTDGYVSARDDSNSTNYNQVFFPGNPNRVLRLTAIDYTGDSNITDLLYFAGTTPFIVYGILNSTQLIVSPNGGASGGNFGVITNQLAIIQRPDTNTMFAVLINHTNNNTNVFLAGGSTLGYTPVTNDIVWITTNRYLTRVGLGRVIQSGENLFAARPGAPMAIRLSPALQQSNRLQAAVRYQPL